MLRHRWLVVSLTMLLLAVLLLLGQPSSAAETTRPTAWQVVGQIGGPTQAVAVQGNYAYVGIGLRLLVLDVTNPITPTEIGSTTPFPYFVEDIAVSGTYAYVAAGGAGLRVVDISDPANPTEIGTWDSPGYAEGVAVSGDTVYLADGPYGLWVVDVSNPADPTPVGSAYDMNYAFEVAVSGSHAYIAAAGAGLLVADVSDPAHPVKVGNLDTTGYAYGVAVAGNRAYLADAWDGLRIVDIADPTHPTLQGTCDTPGWALGVVVAGSTAYVADGTQGLRVVDVSDPTTPSELGAYQASGFGRRLDVWGDVVYLADLQGGLRVLTVSDPAHPTPVGLYSSLTDARRLAVAGDYAYVAGGAGGGMRVIDISDPGRPTEVSVFDTPGSYASSVAVSGSTAYLAAMFGDPYDLYVIDISNPAAPVEIGSISTWGMYREITLQGQIVYVADETGLRLINVSEPSVPADIGSIALDQNRQMSDGVAVSGTLAHVADALDGVKIVDVSDPGNLVLVGVYDSPGFAQGVAVAGQRVYAADSQAGLYLADVTDPAQPFELGFYDTPGVAESVTLSGTLAYVSDGGSGMQVIDVSDPASPTLAGACDTPGFAWFTVVRGNYAYVADGSGGLLILEKTGARMTKGPHNHLAGHSMGVGQTGAGLLQSRITVSATTTADKLAEAAAPILRVSTTVTVTSILDSGPGTLRQALLDAGSGDRIIFDPAVFPPANPQTITLQSELPPLAQGQLTLDASDAGVILDGSLLTGAANGLLITSDGNIVRGLQILHFSSGSFSGSGERSVGVHIVMGRYNVVGGDRAKGKGPTGQGNVISNNDVGIVIHADVGPSYPMSNTIVGNLVGTDASGMGPLGNFIGIQIEDAASNNTVGGAGPGERNVISGSLDRGIQIIGGGVFRNQVVGNYIGTNISGNSPLGNAVVGVVIECGATGNTVGGSDPGDCNVISANGNGVIISDPATAHNAVIGNYIGTDASGTQALGNGNGILVWSSGFNRVGGTSPGEGNLISGNVSGISIGGLEKSDNLILGNRIGTDVSGSAALPNGTGISINEGTRHNHVGGATQEEGNVISGNNGSGVVISDAGIEYNTIAGNRIGTDATGATPLGNTWVGVQLADYSLRNFVQGNTVVYNGDSGVQVTRSPFNTLRRNSIHGNIGAGIFLTEGGNQMLPAPIILTVTETTVSGTACPGSTVEVFSDDEDEGRVYEGTTVADGTGHFTFDKGSPLAGPYLTATATDGQGNTSEFSAPVARLAQLYLPLVLKSH
jgi:parallel beta-helix repeat protein